MNYLKRALIAVIFSLFFAKSLQAEQKVSNPCVATLDWTVAETLIALGEDSFCAMGEIASYQHWVAEPRLPENLIDLGIRMQPNPEQVWQLSTSKAPLHFINSSFYASTTPMLSKFAEVSTADFYKEGDAWQNILDASQKVADLIGKPESYQRLMQHYWQNVAKIRPLVREFTDRPVALVQFIDARHLRIYAENSPFGAVLKQLGFQNAWAGEHNSWGFATIEMTQLAKLASNSRFVVVKPYPTNIAASLKYNTLWQHLPMAQDPLVLPAVWTFGGVPSAERFANVLANALINGGEAW